MEAKLKAEAEVAEKKRKLEEEKSKALAVRTYVTEETQVLIVNDSAAQWSSFAKRIQGLSCSYVWGTFDLEFERINCVLLQVAFYTLKVSKYVLES